MIPDAILNQIQDRVDIVEVVSAFVPLKRAGRNFKAPCPFHHEKSPSFIVSPDKQIFHCFGCGAGGNVFGFLMKQEKKDFLEVVELLAEQTGIEIPKDKSFSPQVAEKKQQLIQANRFAQDFYHQFLLTKTESEIARRYLADRGIRESAITNFKLGYAPEAWDTLARAMKSEVSQSVFEKSGLVIPRKEGDGYYDRFRHRIIFPIVDAKGVCVAFGGRVMDQSLPKYVNSPETDVYSKGRNLYGLFQARKAIREKDSAIVVEGYMDLIACHQAGIENAVASLGTALTAEQVKLIKRNTNNVFILYDADSAGEMATLRGLELFLEEGLDVKIVRLPEGHDPDSYLLKFGAEKFRAELASAKTLFEYRLSLLKQQFDADSLEGKVKIANEMVSLFSKVPNEILRSAWTTELAKNLKLSEESLRAEIEKSERRAKNFTHEELPAVGLKTDFYTVEKLLIGLLVDNPDLVAQAKSQLSEADFQSHETRSLAKRLFTASETATNAAQWISIYRDEPDFVHLISLACAEMDTVQDKKKTFEDCLLWIKRLRIKTERENLKGQIIAAEREGDKNRISKLMFDFIELNKGIKKINEKK